jgi:XTP/dITP diphosphohydrolase
MKLVFATNNSNKLTEVQEMISDEIQLLSLKDIGCMEDIPETANTLEGNAKIKANHITNNYGYNCFADDTGLEVKSLNGDPGVYSARYAGYSRNANHNMDKLLANLSDKADRSAQFRTVITLILDGQSYDFEGICKGKILSEKRGKKGFGYDPIFQPEGYEISFAEMNLEEKNRISHRKRAVEKLVEFLRNL